MDFIIILIVIFLVWRYFKKKKTNAAGNQTTSPINETKSSGSTRAEAVQQQGNTSTISSDLKQKFQGCPIYTPQRFTGENNRITVLVDEKLSGKEKTLAEKFGAGTPEYVFACAKSYYDEYLAKYKNGKLNIGLNTAPNITLWFDTAVCLARYLQTGFGCVQDAQAALEVILPVEKFGGEQSKSVAASISRDEEVNKTFVHLSEVYLSLAECYACVGKIKESEKYYRMSLAMAKIHGEGVWGAGYFEMKVLNSAMGGFPVPANVDIVSELALKLIQQNKVQGAYALREFYTLREMDYKNIGQSYQKDFSIYLKEGRENGSAYAAYKLGECCLYGKGTEQNVELGLSLLHDASYAKNLNATMVINMYLEDFNTYSYRDANGKKLSSSASSAFYRAREMWEERVDNMAEDTKELTVIQKVIDGCAGAEDIIGPRLKPTVFPNVDTKEEIPKAESDDTPIHRMPHIITDDSGREWEFDSYIGDAVRYKISAAYAESMGMKTGDALNDGTVLIEQRHISGRTAALFSNTFHW